MTDDLARRYLTTFPSYLWPSVGPVCVVRCAPSGDGRMNRGKKLYCYVLCTGTSTYFRICVDFVSYYFLTDLLTVGYSMYK